MAEDTAVAEAEPEVQTTPESQPQSEETTPQAEQEPKQEAPAEGPGNSFPEGVSSKEEWLSELLAKEHDPARDDFNDEELDILDEYYDGKLKPASEKKAEEKKEEPEADPDPKAEKPKEENQEEKPQEIDQKTIDSNSSLDLSIMSELGAKDKSEVIDKIKGLRAAVSGKLERAPEYQKVQNDLKILQTHSQNEKMLLTDLMAGKPEALDFFQKNYGLTVSNARQATPSNAAPQEATGNDPFVIPKEKFIDEEAADAVNGVLANVKAQLDEFKSFRQDYTQRVEKEESTSAHREAKAQQIDDMVMVAAKIPKLAEIPNLRDAVTAWSNGAADPRMDYFADLFEIANKNGVKLTTAMEIDLGRKAALAVKQAKEEGRKEAYSHQPNKSLSDIQGKAVSSPEDYSEIQIKEMIEHGKMPDNWFDADDNPNPKTIPKAAYPYFWPNGEVF